MSSTLSRAKIRLESVPIYSASDVVSGISCQLLRPEKRSKIIIPEDGVTQSGKAEVSVFRGLGGQPRGGLPDVERDGLGDDR